ncbi:MAG: hypothetical protein PF961_20490 [Planctomycetota bacterium]|nr:hypothetical protein [Planctomycetota bacterium]
MFATWSLSVVPLGLTVRQRTGPANIGVESVSLLVLYASSVLVLSVGA